MKPLLNPKLLTAGFLALAFIAALLAVQPAAAAEMKGKVLLQTEKNGELWYVNPVNGNKIYLRDAADMFRLMRQQGLGINQAHLDMIPAYGQDAPAKTDQHLVKRLSGRILIDVQGNGAAWYVNPDDSKRYSLGRPAEGFGLFRKIAVGVSDAYLNQYMTDKSIVDIAVEAKSFTTLVAAVQAAGLADTLASEGPFTVFAPTDDAFKKLPAGTVEALLNDIPKLKSILLYHVVAGKVTADQVVKINEAATLNGQSVKIKVEGGKVMIDGATVTTADVMAKNGVIHIIDSVILPQ